jgi:hypothetical protein
MNKITVSRIAIAAGLCIFAVATWFAFRTPSLPPLPVATTTASSSSAASSSSQTSSLPSVAVAAQSEKTAAPRTIMISITSPTSGAQWAIGSENTISWNKAAGVTGELYLVSATSGAAVGWVQQNIGPNQTYFPWNTQNLFLGKTDPAGKDVVPGKYFLKLSFSSPSVPTAVSAPFFIVASTTL